MYTLLSGLYKYAFQKDEFFVVILGLDNAGKTTYLEQTKTQFTKNYKMMHPQKITTTVGLNIGKIDIGRTRLNFWDLGGQQELQSLWDKYYAESHAVVYLVDASDRERLEESRLAFECMLTSDALHGVPLLLVANKQDLPGCLSLDDIKDEFKHAGRGVGRRDCTVQAASALRGDGVHEGIDWVVQCVMRNSIDRPPTQKDIT